MSVVKSFSVGRGDTFYIRHNTDNFTIIDCCLSTYDQKDIVDEIRLKSTDKTIRRFISTHPDEDHICGLEYLDDELKLVNFYCVDNRATKEDVTDDFTRYCELRDSTKAFNIYKKCKRRWMNLDGDGRSHSGISILWPDTDNEYYKEALTFAAAGGSPNNISAIVKYGLVDGPSFLWMGDLETSFMEDIEPALDLSHIDILFAPHHGRDSGKVPQSLLDKLTPNLVVIGEASSDHLNYYSTCDTITQNSAGDITFDCVTGWAHVYVLNPDYKSDCLTDRNLPHGDLGYYAGSVKAT